MASLVCYDLLLTTKREISTNKQADVMAVVGNWKIESVSKREAKADTRTDDDGSSEYPPHSIDFG
jgi:hypothetical protein